MRIFSASLVLITPILCISLVDFAVLFCRPTPSWPSQDSLTRCKSASALSVRQGYPFCALINTVCEKCRKQVCNFTSFCDESRSWSSDFRKIYVKYQRSLQQKLMSKEKAKAQSPPIADDSASNVSVDSHVSIPVVMLPIDAQSVDINDDVVEFQQPQPEATPPPLPPPLYLTPRLWHLFFRDLIRFFLSLRVVAPHS